MLRSSSFATASVLVSLTAIACSGGAEVAEPQRGEIALPVPDAKPSPVVFPGRAERPLVSPDVIDLGAVAAFEEVEIDVPAGTLGFNVVVQSELDRARVGVLRITSPTGEIVHDRYTPKGGTHATSLSPFTAIAAASVPQGEGASLLPLVPGKWRIVVGDGRFLLPDGKAPPPPFAQTVPPMTVRVVLQRGATEASVFTGARLDIVVHVPDGLRVGEREVDAASARLDASVAERFRVFYAGMKRYFDVDPGEIRFVPAPASLKSLNGDTLNDAFAVAHGADGEQALHVVLTNDVMVGIGMNAWGVAPGVPGAAVLNGTPMSGVVLAVGDTDPVLDGLVLLHESGHFFGLSHTSELDGTNADPLDDTPRCPTLDGADPSTAQACPDRLNLMFPTYTTDWSALLEVSASQRAVLQASPVLRVYADGKGPARAAPLSADPITFVRPTKSLPAPRPFCTHIGVVRGGG